MPSPTGMSASNGSANFESTSATLKEHPPTVVVRHSPSRSPPDCGICGTRTTTSTKALPRMKTFFSGASERRISGTLRISVPNREVRACFENPLGECAEVDSIHRF